MINPKKIQKNFYKERLQRQNFHAIAVENKSVIKYPLQKNFEICKVSAKRMRNRCLKLIKHLKVRFLNDFSPQTQNTNVEVKTTHEKRQIYQQKCQRDICIHRLILKRANKTLYLKTICFLSNFYCPFQDKSSV